MIGSMQTESIQEMLEFATRLALESGELAAGYAGKFTIAVKPDTSVVTEADTAVEAHILGKIREVYPDHATCAEETGNKADSARANARYCWVIDPIDGTRNYASGFPCFCTSIAVLDRGLPVVGVVYEHNRRAMYVATAGGGTRLDDKGVGIVEVSPNDDLLIGIPSSKDNLTVRVLRNWIGTSGIVLRNLGSTALHLAMVGAGSLGAAYCKRCKIWDIAAGALMVTEAGGVITDLRGNPRIPFDLTRDPSDDLSYITAAPATHQRLLDQIRPSVEA